VISAIDRLYLQRAYELAARAIGDTSPNPPVGAVVLKNGRIVGEGYHHRAGEPHAEVDALRDAGNLARGATLYVSLEPCKHAGRTPPCTQAVLAAGIARVVIGTIDPSRFGGGAAELRERGLAVDVAGDACALDLVELFAGSIERDRPYLALKMACSLDGCITSKPGVREQLTGAAFAQRVREFRIAHDAVMVGAGTVRVDDPLLTVRPPHHRLRPYLRVVACESDVVPASSRAFEVVPGYDRTLVLAPSGLRETFAALCGVADVLFVGDQKALQLDLPAAMRALRDRGVASVLCEGGPTLGARLIAADLVDRLYWAIAPRLLANENAVPVLARADLAGRKVRIDRTEQVGDDVMIAARCSVPFGSARNGGARV
jgi:diaminohydroxyphosphoribosylaminopyrimidine deaminase/5-amino-6-(5-phosphoribosylamino)uracil reductase